MVTLMVRMVPRDARHDIMADFGIAGPFCGVLVRLYVPSPAGSRVSHCSVLASCYPVC